MSRAVLGAFLLVVGAAMALGVTANPAVPRSVVAREIPVPGPLAWVQSAQAGCGSVPTRSWEKGVWHCVLSDEFNGQALDLTRWSAVTTSGDNFSSGIPPAYVCYLYDPRTVTVSGGVLSLSVVKLDDQIDCGGAAAQPTKFIGGSVSTKYRLAQTYGRYEVRARFPTDKRSGLQSSIVLVSDRHEYGQGSGEVDIAEYFTKWRDRVVPYVRYSHPDDDPTETTDTCTVGRPDRFHLYALQWTPERIDMTVDGRRCVSTTWAMGEHLKRPAPFDKPFILSIFEALGVSKAAFDMDKQPDLPATMQVDYVHIWGARGD